MTPIPLFEALQNEMHRRMGCSHIGCFNAGVRNSSSYNPYTAPSTWTNGLYGFICEGKHPIDEGTIYTLGKNLNFSRHRSSRAANEQGAAQVNMDDIRANVQYGGNVGEAKRFGDDIQRYLDMSDKERKILEQEASQAFRFTPEDTPKFLSVISRIKQGEFGDPLDSSPASRLLTKIGRALRTGSDGFYHEEDGLNSFPDELYNDPLNFEWEEASDSFGSGSYASREMIGESKREG